MGRDQKYMCQKPLPKNEQAGSSVTSTLRSQINNEAGSSEDEDEDEEDNAAASAAASASLPVVVPAAEKPPQVAHSETNTQ